MRHKRVNTLDFACWFYASRQPLRELDAVVAVNKPLREFFGLWMTKYKTLQGHRDFFTGLAEGSLSDLVSDIWEVLTTPDVLTSLGISCTSNDISCACNDQKVAQYMLETCNVLTGDLAIYEFEFTHSLYGMSSRLLSADADKVDADLSSELFFFVFKELCFYKRHVCVERLL